MTYVTMNIRDVVLALKADRTKMARFSYFCAGNLYYNVEFDGIRYQFYIEATPEEVGSAIFNCEIRAVSLLRYIRKCIDSGEFIRLDY